MDHSTQIANDIKKEVTQQAASPKDAVAYIVFDEAMAKNQKRHKN
jgi:hypothetical protein